MDLTIRITIFNNVTHRDAICFKLGDRIFTSVTMVGLQTKASICSRIKENLFLYCRKFSVFVSAVII